MYRFKCILIVPEIRDFSVIGFLVISYRCSWFIYKHEYHGWLRIALENRPQLCSIAELQNETELSDNMLNEQAMERIDNTYQWLLD